MNKAPKIEFFWRQHKDRGLRQKTIDEARCVHWDDPEYEQLESNTSFSTIGASGFATTSFEIVVELVTLLTKSFATPEAYINLMNDLAKLAEAGHLPEYAAPVLISATECSQLTAHCEIEPTEDQQLEFEDIQERFETAFHEFMRRESYEQEEEERP